MIRHSVTSLIRFALLTAAVLVKAGCETDPGGLTSGGGLVSGTWNAIDGLSLRSGGVELNVPTSANPSAVDLTAKALSAGDLSAAGAPTGWGIEQGVEFGPSGTQFDEPAMVTVQLARATPLAMLPVLVKDESTGAWGDAGSLATVSDDGLTATFEVMHFSTYGVANPSPPGGGDPIEAPVVAGTGFFEGQPFNLFPSPESATAYMAYSSVGDVFGMSMIQVDITNPATGDIITLAAGMHASMVEPLDNMMVGYVTPVGALSGPSLYEDGGFPKPITGLMFLRVFDGRWMVDTYGVFEGGVVFGQGSGDL